MHVAPADVYWKFSYLSQQRSLSPSASSMHAGCTCLSYWKTNNSNSALLKALWFEDFQVKGKCFLFHDMLVFSLGLIYSGWLINACKRMENRNWFTDVCAAERKYATCMPHLMCRLHTLACTCIAALSPPTNVFSTNFFSESCPLVIIMAIIHYMFALIYFYSRLF